MPYREGGPPEGKMLGRWWAGYVAHASLVVAFLLVVATCVAAYGSERDGVAMAAVTAGPLGFALASTAAAYATRWRKDETLRFWAPLGIGCAAGIFCFLGTVGFFATVWRHL